MSLAVVAADWRGATLRGAQVVHVPWATLRAAAYQEDRVLRDAYARAYVGALVLVARDAVERHRREPTTSSAMGHTYRNSARDQARGNAERAIADARAEIDAWEQAEARIVALAHMVGDRIAAGQLVTEAARQGARAQEQRQLEARTGWLRERRDALRDWELEIKQEAMRSL